MGDEGPEGPVEASQVDWEDVTRRLRGLLLSRISKPAEWDIDKMVQNGLRRLHLFFEREHVALRLGGLVSTIADRVWKDEWRRRRAEARYRAYPDEETMARMPDPQAERRVEEAVDVRRRAHAILLYFKEADPDCYTLAFAHMAGFNWKEVASAAAISHDKTRKDWERCRERFLKRLQEDTGFLGRYLRAPEAEVEP